MHPNRSKFYLIVFFILSGALTFGFLRSGQKSDGAQNSEELNLYAMSEYLPKDVIEEFEKLYGVKVRYDNFSNNEELLAKLQAGATGYDIIIPSDYMVTALIANRLLQPIDKSRVPNLVNVGTDFQNLSFDPSGDFSVPFMWGTTGIAYNSKFVKEPVESWDLLFKAEYRGRIALLEDAREAIGMTMRMLGYSGNSTSKDEISKAENLLAKLKPSVRIFTADPKQHLQSEDVWIAQVYSGDAKQSAVGKPEVKYFVPKEGATLWVDNMAIPVGAQHEDLAHKFINFILEPRIAKVMVDASLYNTPNVAADSLIEDKNLSASYIQKIKSAKLEVLKDLGSDMQLWDDAWTKLKGL